jgi:hypothetical protein
MAKRRVPCRPTKDEIKEYRKHLDRLITLLWTASALRDARGKPSVRALREWLASVRARSEAEYRRAYRRQVVVMCNLGGVARWPAGRLPDVHAEEEQLDAGARAGYDCLIRTVLISAGLFNREFPFEYVARQILVAHLLLADDEITEAQQLPEPVPWTFALLREEGRPLRLWADLDIREQEQRIRSRLERALFAAQQPRAPLPPLKETAERREEKAANRRAAAARAHDMHQAGKRWSDIASDPQIKALLRVTTDISRDTVYRLLNEHIATHNTLHPNDPLHALKRGRRRRRHPR